MLIGAFGDAVFTLGLFLCEMKMDLITTQKEVTMTSREIAELTQKEHRHVVRDIQVMMGELEIDPEGYAQLWTHPQNGQTYREYALPKDLTLTLISGYSVLVRKRIIDRWQELETNQVPALPDFTNPAEAARAWAEQYEKAEAAQQKLEQAKPKVQHYDAVVEREGLLNATQVAQKLGMSAIALNRHLESFDVYSKAVKRSRTFKQWFIDKGLGEVKQVGDGYTQPLFTLRGEAWIIERLISEGVYTP